MPLVLQIHTSLIQQNVRISLLDLTLHHLCSIICHNCVHIHRIILKLSGDTYSAIGVIDIVPRDIVGHRVLIALGINFSVCRVHSLVPSSKFPCLSIPNNIVPHIAIKPQWVSIAVKSDALLGRVVNPFI